MAAPTRMLRLLQGDVGAGKTIVAMLALLDAVEAGTQGALMAPTEILARQHMASLEPLAKAAGVRMALLTGRERGAPRDETLAALADGRDRHPRRHACAVLRRRRVPRSGRSRSSTSSIASACISA